jgi:hypothetical protein
MYDINDFLPDCQTALYEYLCSLCTGVYCDPILDVCGHIFCRDCITKHMEVFKSCPINKDKTLTHKDLTKMVFIANLVAKQKVYCKNKKIGCEWSGPLSELENHITNECCHQLLKCSYFGCQHTSQRDSMETHKSICDYRPTSCPHCEITFPTASMNSHFENCPKMKVVCPQNCDCLIQRCEVQNHIKTICVNTVVECEFKPLGCDTNLVRKNFNEHSKNNSEKHIGFVLESVLSMNNRLKELETQFHKLDQKLTESEAKIQNKSMNTNNQQSQQNSNNNQHNNKLPTSIVQNKKNSIIDDETEEVIFTGIDNNKFNQNNFKVNEDINKTSELKKDSAKKPNKVIHKVNRKEGSEFSEDSDYEVEDKSSEKDSPISITKRKQHRRSQLQKKVVELIKPHNAPIFKSYIPKNVIRKITDSNNNINCSTGRVNLRNEEFDKLPDVDLNFENEEDDEINNYPLKGKECEMAQKTLQDSNANEKNLNKKRNREENESKN